MCGGKRNIFQKYGERSGATCTFIRYCQFYVIFFIMHSIQLTLISSVLLCVVIAAPQQQSNFYDSGRSHQNQNSPQQQPNFYDGDRNHQNQNSPQQQSNFYENGRGQNQNSPQQYSQTPVPIISQKNEQNPDGSYFYSYEAGNGIAMEERGAIKNLGEVDKEINSVQGFFAYPGTDGVLYQVSYTADERGFLASGAHLPTSPPLPEAVIRALENLPKDNTEYDDNGFPLPPRNNVGYQQNSQPTGFPHSQPTGFSNSQPTSGFSNSQPGAFSNSQPTGFSNSPASNFLNSQSSRPTGPSSQSRPTGPSSSGPSSFGEQFQGFGGRA